MATSADSMPIDTGEIGRISQIPVRNLWLLMLYASHLFRQLDAKRCSVEENPDDIPDLVAEILAHQVERRIRRNLSYGYQTRAAVLSRLRGRIDLIHTERRHLLERGKVACHYDELTVNTARNRFVRSALEEVSRIVHRKNLAHRCRSLAESLRRMGVTGERPSRHLVSADRFGRHDAQDREMLAAAQLAFDLALPTEATGTKHLLAPERNVDWIRRLFEKAIAGFYDIVLSPEGWQVRPSKTIHWPVEQGSSGIEQILPSMRTDIVLDHVQSRRRIVIDTKFNAPTTRGWYREESLRSGYLYQIYAYLRSQENIDDPPTLTATGLLLHPSTGARLDEWLTMQGHTIRFATVDLASEATEIRSQLLDVIAPVPAMPPM